MMTRLLEMVRGLVADELAESRKNFDEYFHSPHEGYGVLYEELYEAKTENEQVDKRMNNLLRCIHEDNVKGIINNAGALEVYATNAACEYIQVAAMARKTRESVKRGCEP